MFISLDKMTITHAIFTYLTIATHANFLSTGRMTQLSFIDDDCILSPASRDAADYLARLKAPFHYATATIMANTMPMLRFTKATRRTF